MSSTMHPSASFAFADLFAGIGGFHAALAAIGGHLAIAAEKDAQAAATYKRNWGVDPFSDVVELANDAIHEVPALDVLAGGFPCQPFSKSGRQLGMHEERGQVFDEMLKIIEARKPALLVLENVRNIVGPRQKSTVWPHIIQSLRRAGYAVSDIPVIVSPHNLPPEFGGAPQSRERVFILGVNVGDDAVAYDDFEAGVVGDPDPSWVPATRWDLFDGYVDSFQNDLYRWSTEETAWLDVWGDFLRRTAAIRLPGHPLWSDYWNDDASIDVNAPAWKQSFERRNIEFWESHRSILHAWRRANPQLARFPVSRRKFEWQAGDQSRDMSNLLIHLRPSGIRVKKPNYAPALVAMSQTPLIGAHGRRVSPRESARLQGFPDWFEFDHQPDKATYKQLGNAVNVGVAYYVVTSFVRAHEELLRRAPGGAKIANAVQSAPADPRLALQHLRDVPH